MKTKFLLSILPAILSFAIFTSESKAQNYIGSNGNSIQQKKVDNHISTLLRDEISRNLNRKNPSMVCTDTVYSVLQNKLYFYFGNTCSPSPNLYFEIFGSYGAAATNDSAIVWLMTDDKDGPGPKTSLPDSMVPGHNIHNTTNRAKWVGGFTPSYISNSPGQWISPFSFQYGLPSFWADSGRSLSFTPIAWDSTHAGQLFEKDNCFGYGQPIQKIVMNGIYTEHFYSCDSGTNFLHLIVKGGFPQYNHYNGYGDAATYNLSVNSTFYSAHYNDTLIIPAENLNSILITDSIGENQLADGCVTYYDTLVLYPSVYISGLSTNVNDNAPNDTFNILPAPSGAMRIDFLCSDPVSNGIYLLNAQGDTIYYQYPLGISVGTGSIADIPSSLFVYNIPLTGGPYRVVATNDLGSGWQDSTCNGLQYNGYLKIFDLATGNSLSSKLYPLGDSICGSSGNWVVDTFGVYTLTQYNKTQITIDNNPSSLSAIDSSGNAIFSPSTAGAGTYQITFSYNDIKSNLCDLDTTITVVVNSTVGINPVGRDENIQINNPVHEQLIVRQKNSNADYFELVDATGKFILLKKLLKDQSIDVSFLAQGVYIIKFFDSGKSLVETKRLIKE